MSAKTSRKIGLVLSGGGAKGAYEVGVVKALARLGLKPDVIAGASIGALNGAVIASSTDLVTAARDLEAVWTGLDEEVLQWNASPAHYIALVGLHVALRSALGASRIAPGVLLSSIPAVLSLFREEDKQFLALLDNSPLQKWIDKTLDWDRLLAPSSPDLYVSVYPSMGGRLAGTIADGARYAAGVGESEFLRIKDLSQDDAVKAVMASAALPLAFKAVRIGKKLYRDGGMGGRVEEQGNTPAQPLVDTGCTHAVVVFLSQGALWNRFEWPSLTALEIRPSAPIDKGRPVKALMDFDPARIRDLIDHGENDAMVALGRLQQAHAPLSGMRAAQQELEEAMRPDPIEEAVYQDTMESIRKLSR